MVYLDYDKREYTNMEGKCVGSELTYTYIVLHSFLLVGY